MHLQWKRTSIQNECKAKNVFGWTIPLTPFGLQCMTEVCLLYYSFSLSVFSCLSQNSEDPYTVDLCMSVVKLWRTVCTGNGKMKCITWAYESCSKTLKMKDAIAEEKIAIPFAHFLFILLNSFSGKLKMYRQHLFWFYSPQNEDLWNCLNSSQYQFILFLPASSEMVIASHIKSLFTKCFVPFRCNLINWSLTFAFVFIKPLS